MYLVQGLSGDGRPSAGAKDTAIMGAYLSYPFSLSLVVVGSLFYISIIHSYKYISKKAPTFREEMNCEMFIFLEIFKIVYETPL